MGDGKTAKFWYDFWNDMGPLICAFGESGTRELRLRREANVCEAAANGHWLLPHARSDEAETLQIVLSTMTPPSDENGRDVYLWRNGEDHYVRKFSTKATWIRLREPSPLVPWSRLVWFKEEISRCSFVTWMVALARLPTRDRLASWGMNVPTQCVLCLSGTESHSHLFFQCPFVAAIWAKFSASPVLLAPVSIQALAGVIAHPHLAGVAGMDAVLKLILQVIVYCIWRERNVRIFQQVSTSVAEVFSRVDRLIKDRLLAISRHAQPPPSPSLLLLYLSLLPAGL